MSTQKRRMSLKKEEQQKLIKTYEDALVELKTHTEKLIAVLTTMAEKEKFKQIVDIANASIIFYSSDLKKIMENNYTNWMESKASISKQVEMSLAGDQAVQEAKQLENNFKSTIEKMYANLPQPIAVDDSAPNIDPEKMQQLTKEISKYVEKVNDAEKKHKGKIDKYAEENQLFLGIQGHVSATYVAASDGFAARATQVKGLAEELLAILNQGAQAMSDQNESMKQAGVNTAKNVDQFPKPRFQ